MRVFIRTFGCTLNQSDSEAIAGLLLENGHELVSSLEEAELVLFNTCTVKDNPEKRFFSEMKKVLSSGKKVVVAGCIPQASPDNALLQKISVVGVRNISKVVFAVDEAANGRVVKLLDLSDEKRLELPKQRKNPVIEIIPISAGCLGECSYCKTRMARGRLQSYDLRVIKQKMESALEQGVKEIWLTSQDNGAYGKDIGLSLPALLDELLKIKPDGIKPNGAGDVGNTACIDYMIRIGMINPNHALEFVDELVQILNHPNVFKFVHIPLQSGSNRILKLMNRKYSAEDFVFLVEKLRAVPGITIATDIIAGFPGETDSEFEETYKLIERLQIPVLNITKFCPRPGTPAKKLKVLPNKVSKDRTLALANLHKKMRLNLRWVGWEGDVLIDEIGKNKSFVGRNQFYKPIALKNPGLKLGVIVRARIVKAEEHHLEAELM